MATRLLGYTLLCASVLLVGAVVYLNSGRSAIPLLFSPVQMQNVLWQRYKQEYLEPGSFRTLDKQRQFITTSEGQSYTMLRAAWMGDKETFDNSWVWTRENLGRSEDNLFSWLYGKRADGTWDVLTSQGGNTTASDADQDIALALIFAYARWQEREYLESAQGIVRDIWEKEVITIRGVPYLVANNLEKFSTESTAIINPSYLAPYAYRIFALVDKTHPWNSLVSSSYTLLSRSMAAGFGSESARLPPDWVRIDKQSGALLPPRDELTVNFGYDAMRVPWRLALDWQWYKEERAKNTLEEMTFLSEQWREGKSLATTYSHSGATLTPYETPAMYGGTLGHFMASDPLVAKEIYERKLQYLFGPGINDWKERLSYYDDNWAWFGISLYYGLLPNLAASLPESAFN